VLTILSRMEGEKENLKRQQARHKPSVQKTGSAAAPALCSRRYGNLIVAGVPARSTSLT
jgi:hypothetical protein